MTSSKQQLENTFEDGMTQPGESKKTAYADQYRGIDFRKHPELYRIGRGEQGVLIAEPYKSEILPLWRFATVEQAKKSAEAIYQKFTGYRKENDFVGMDMARKFLQMGWTRARRYANHTGGKKYDSKGKVLPQRDDAMTSEKAKAAEVFRQYYDKARLDPQYLGMKESFRQGRMK